MNEVKLADIMFSLLSVCLSVRIWLQCSINANCSKTVKDTDLKFNKHVHRDSQDNLGQGLHILTALPTNLQPSILYMEVK